MSRYECSNFGDEPRIVIKMMESILVVGQRSFGANKNEEKIGVVISTPPRAASNSSISTFEIADLLELAGSRLD